MCLLWFKKMKTVVKKSPRPVLPIQRSKMNGLRQMFNFYIRTLPQVRDRPGYLQDAVVRPRRQLQLLHCLLDQDLPRLIDPADILDYTVEI